MCIAWWFPAVVVFLSLHSGTDALRPSMAVFGVLRSPSSASGALRSPLRALRTLCVDALRSSPMNLAGIRCAQRGFVSLRPLSARRLEMPDLAGTREGSLHLTRKQNKYLKVSFLACLRCAVHIPGPVHRVRVKGLGSRRYPTSFTRIPRTPPHPPSNPQTCQITV